MRFLAVLLVLSFLSACTSPAPLSPGLTARMDAPGAQLNRGDAISLINSLRATNGVAPLVLDADLNIKADILAQEYARSGDIPKRPDGVAAIRASAGYADFAQTFSGWRGATSSTEALVDPSYLRAGLGVAYSGNTAHGTYWVLLLAEGVQQVSAQ